MCNAFIPNVDPSMTAEDIERIFGVVATVFDVSLPKPANEKTERYFNYLVRFLSFSAAFQERFQQERAKKSLDIHDLKFDWVDRDGRPWQFVVSGSIVSVDEQRRRLNLERHPTRILTKDTPSHLETRANAPTAAPTANVESPTDEMACVRREIAALQRENDRLQQEFETMLQERDALTEANAQLTEANVHLNEQFRVLAATYEHLLASIHTQNYLNIVNGGCFSALPTTNVSEYKQ